MALDLVFGKTSRRCSRGDIPSSTTGIDVDMWPASYFKKHPLSYGAKTAILLAAGAAVVWFSRGRSDQ
jgi:hypothetical protein